MVRPGHTPLLVLSDSMSVKEGSIHPKPQHKENSVSICLLGSYSFENLLYSPS